MKKIKLLVFMMLGMSCMIQSCKTDLDEVKAVSNETPIDRRKYDVNLVDESIVGNFKIVDGILHFKDFETFRKVRDGLDKISMKERIAFAGIKGLNSRLSKTQNVLEKIANAKSLEEKESLIKANSEIIIKDNYGIAMSKISDDCTSALVTTEGMVYIGKILYMFTPNIEYIVYDGDRNKLIGVKNGRKVNESAELSIINTSQKSVKNARLCNGLDAYEASNLNNSSFGKMFTIVDAPEFNYSGNNLYTIRVHSYSKAYAMGIDIYGNFAQILTSHIFSVNYSIKMYRRYQTVDILNSPYTWSDSRSGYGSSIDFHFNDYAYNQPYSLNNNMDVYIETNPVPSTVFQNFQHRYNYAELAPGQWIYPNCL